MSRQTQKKEWWWIDPTGDNVTKYLFWPEFLEDWIVTHDGKYRIRKMIGLLHQGAEIVLWEEACPEEWIEGTLLRILFYLRYADFGRNMWSEDDILGKLRKMAYNKLVEKVMSSDPMNACLVVCLNQDQEKKRKNLSFLVEVAQEIVDFFLSHPQNRPKEPHHRKIVAEVLLRLHALAERLEHEPGTAPVRIQRIKNGAAKSLVACRFYQTIVDEQIFAAMDFILEEAKKDPRSRELLGEPLDRESIESRFIATPWAEIFILTANVPMDCPGLVYLRLLALRSFKNE